MKYALTLTENQPEYKFSRLEKNTKLAKAKKDLAEAISADREFQRSSQEAYAFHAGHQWTRDQKYVMETVEGRPALVFNLIRPTVDLILGVSENNRTDVMASPTEQNDDFLCEIINDLKDKVYDLGNIEDEEDDAFENAVISGRGFVALDVMPDPKRPLEIKVEAVSVPVHEVRLDPAGRRNDLKDHRKIYWEKWITIEDFCIRYPKHRGKLKEILAGDRQVTETALSDEVDVWDMIDMDSEDSDYDTPLDVNFYDRSKGRVKVVHMEYWDTYERYYAFNRHTGEVEEFDKEQLPVLKQVIPNFEYEKILDKKVHWYQFTGDFEIYDGPSPIPYDGFSIVPCFAYKDKSQKGVTHFGVVRGMVDPQKEVNKRWSQTLNLLMKQSQGGWFVEQEAYVDQAQFEDSINAPGGVTYLKKDAIAEGRLKEKPFPQLPSGPAQMEQFAQDIMKKISGVNPDLLGMDAGRQEPGIVVRLRQQQGLVLLSKLFKSFKQMRKEVAARVFAIIMEYMPDSQVKRILGDNERYIFRGGLVADIENGFVAPLRNLRDLKYNISLEDSPKNMTKMMSQLAIFMEMMSKGFPTDPKVVVEKLDLPASEKAKWLKFIEESQKRQSQMAEMQMQAEMQEKQGKLQIEQGKVKIQAEKVKGDHAIAMQKIEQEEVSDRRDYAVDIAKLDLEDQKMVRELVFRLSSKGGEDAAKTQP